MHDTCAGGTCRMCCDPVIVFIACAIRDHVYPEHLHMCAV